MEKDKKTKMNFSSFLRSSKGSPTMTKTGTKPASASKNQTSRTSDSRLSSSSASATASSKKNTPPKRSPSGAAASTHRPKRAGSVKEVTSSSKKLVTEKEPRRAVVSTVTSRVRKKISAKDSVTEGEEGIESLDVMPSEKIEKKKASGPSEGGVKKKSSKDSASKEDKRSSGCNSGTSGKHTKKVMKGLSHRAPDIIPLKDKELKAAKKMRIKDASPPSSPDQVMLEKEVQEVSNKEVVDPRRKEGYKWPWNIRIVKAVSLDFHKDIHHTWSAPEFGSSSKVFLLPMVEYFSTLISAD